MIVIFYPFTRKRRPSLAMSLLKVYVSWEALFCCMTQALATEHQEVMGLLLGSWEMDPTTGKNIVAEVRHVVVMKRTDRRRDRVEVGYEQMAEAEMFASSLTADTGIDTRIIGWVHSHPHITVLPSHVDIRTQQQYQQMDSGFVGLIFAVFQDDKKSKTGRIQVTAFQAISEGEQASYSRTGEATINIDDDDVDEEEVNLMVANDSSTIGSLGYGGGLVRKPIPLIIGKKGSTSEGDAVFTGVSRAVVSLQEVLMQEERLCYEAAVNLNIRNNRYARNANITNLYHASIYSKALAALLQESALPLINTLESMMINLCMKKEELLEANQALETTLTSLPDLSSEELDKFLAQHLEEDNESKKRVDMMDIDKSFGESRGNILQKAANGVMMVLENVEIRGENVCHRSTEVLVSMTRKYDDDNESAAAITLGYWYIQIGNILGGRLQKVSRARTKKIVLDLDTGIATLSGPFDSLDLWIEKIRPIVSPF